MQSQHIILYAIISERLIGIITVYIVKISIINSIYDV